MADRISADAPLTPDDDLDPVDVDLDEDEPKLDDKLVVELDDGSVEINLGSPITETKSDTFDENLALKLPESVLSQMADELLRGIDNDNSSRSEWLADRATGIQLLGLRLESGSSGDAAPVMGQSKVRHPLLLEAAVRFQAQASAELLPADGPVKVRNDDPLEQAGELADCLERELNHYLTAVETDYVPDTDGMLFRLGVDGSAFKKVYHDPLKERPVSITVDAVDLIISNGASSLEQAGRVTNQTRMRPSVVKRMQLAGEYRDIVLGDPGHPEKTSAESAAEDIGGIEVNTSPEAADRDRLIYECYCEYDLGSHEKRSTSKVQKSGLPLPYVATIDKESRQILSIRRNWKPNDKKFIPKVYFVHYCYMRGYGFYGIGLAHLLGNTTNALTATWREFIDAGMFANFPGFLYAKGISRQNTMELRVPPGGGVAIDLPSGQAIGNSVMPLPYKSPDASFVAFVENIAETGARLGGIAEITVGEGRQDAPVGTTLALIEQATKPMMAVHKRLHAAQAREFQLLVERFRETPEALWAFSPSPTMAWTAEILKKALADYKIVPQSDPNTASHLQRVLRAQALYQLAKDDPESFDKTAVQTAVMKAIGFAMPAEFLAKAPASPPPPDPKAQADAVEAQSDLINAQTQSAKLDFDKQTSAQEFASADAERKTKETIADKQLQREGMIEHARMVEERNENANKRDFDINKQARDHAHNLHREVLSNSLTPPVTK